MKTPYRRSGILKIQTLNNWARVTVNGKGNSFINSLTITLPAAETPNENTINLDWIFQFDLLYQTKQRATISNPSKMIESLESTFIIIHRLNDLFFAS